MTCKFCGSHNLKAEGGDESSLDRCPKRLICADCGRTVAEGEIDRNALLAALPTLVEEIEKQAQNRTPWRARKEAETLQTLLEAFSVTEETYYVVVELYEVLSHFYRNVYDRRKAYMYALKGSEVALAFADGELAADMAYSAYRFLLYLPMEIRPVIDEEKIKNEHGRYATKVLSYQNLPVMKVDPVEHTEAFLSVYDEVMECVRARLEEEGDLHMPQQTWHLMAEEFKRKGIVWRSPSLMNPRWKFD